MRHLCTFWLVSGLLAAQEPSFVDPICEGADPWVVRHGDEYLWCFSDGNRAIAVHRSRSLTHPGPKHVVFSAPDAGPASRGLWAPELHLLDGRWHVYFAATDGPNANHRTFVLRSAGDDPLGPYTLHGPLYTGDDPEMQADNRWAIDMTVLEVRGRRYAVWSGWTHADDDVQYLFAAPMKSGIELAAPRTRIAHNADHLWERTEETPESRGLHEAPQVLVHGGRTFLTYSCGASWLPTYKIGLLELVGDDPLDPDAWQKHPEPVFRSTPLTYGVGHASFTTSPDRREHWIVYHAKRDREPGWRRAVFVQPFGFTADGFPVFGEPIAPGAPLPLPSGESPPVVELPFDRTFDREGALRGFQWYGHHQMLRVERGQGVEIGVVADALVNDWRSGEKLVLGGAQFDAVRVATRLAVLNGERDAGLLFRVTDPAVGYDAWRGYFAGILPGADRVVLGASDGSTWREIARSERPIDAGRSYELAVEARGTRLRVFLDGEPCITADDAEHAAGSIGLRVVDTHARFAWLRAAEL